MPILSIEIKSNVEHAAAIEHVERLASRLAQLAAEIEALAKAIRTFEKSNR